MVPLAVVAAMAGCWTFNETEYPVEATTAAATNLSVAVVGYKATFTDYEPVTGYSSVYVPGWYGYRYYQPGHFETVASTAYVPLQRESDAYLVRAKERFEGAGFVVGASVPKVAVEVQFDVGGVERLTVERGEVVVFVGLTAVAVAQQVVGDGEEPRSLVAVGLEALLCLESP